MPRYLILQGPQFYPGGADDIVGQTDSLEGAIEGCLAYLEREGPLKWTQVYDLQEEKIVWEADTVDNGTIEVKNSEFLEAQRNSVQKPNSELPDQYRGPIPD